MSRTTRRRLSSEDRRVELLSFGQSFFAEHPVDAFTMDEIADQAGVSKGLLYRHFGGRRGFYVATIAAIAEEVGQLTEPEAGIPFADAFRAALDRYLAWVEDNGEIYRVLVHGGVGVDPEVSAVVEGLRRQTMARVAERAGLRRSATVDVALYGWVCFAENACLEWLNKTRVSRQTMVEVLTGALGGTLAACGVTVHG